LQHVFFRTTFKKTFLGSWVMAGFGHRHRLLLVQAALASSPISSAVYALAYFSSAVSSLAKSCSFNNAVISSALHSLW
jgi:hypothetical protein